MKLYGSCGNYSGYERISPDLSKSAVVVKQSDLYQVRVSIIQPDKITEKKAAFKTLSAAKKFAVAA
tara:strand:+ start:621 stop:818 length:198 start_codon:yes stop_codon:yes gene_type:complete